MHTTSQLDVHLSEGSCHATRTSLSAGYHDTKPQSDILYRQLYSTCQISFQASRLIMLHPDVLPAGVILKLVVFGVFFSVLRPSTTVEVTASQFQVSTACASNSMFVSSFKYTFLCTTSVTELSYLFSYAFAVYMQQAAIHVHANMYTISLDISD